MTAETLKPFLSATIPIGIHHQKRNSISQSAWFYSALVFGFIITVSLLGLEIWNIRRINTLHAELSRLRHELFGPEDNIDIFDDLADFEKTWKSEESQQESKDDSEYYGYDEYGRIQETFDYNNEDDDDNDEGSANTPILDIERDPSDNSGVWPSFERTFVKAMEKLRASEDNRNEDSTEAAKRSARSLRSVHGIPIVEGSYAVHRQQTHTPTDDAIKNVLLNKEPTIRPTMNYDWSNRDKRLNSNNDWNENEINHKEQTHIQTRGSRVMNTIPEDKSKSFRQVMTKSEYSRWQDTVRDNESGRPAKKHRISSNMHKSLQGKEHRMRSTVAVHYGAEPKSSATGNDYSSIRAIDWKASKWVNNLSMDRYFKLENGLLTVCKAGLYQIYAQITFENTESPSGFFVVHNDHRFLECKSSESSSNSCFTSRVVYLNSGDKIHLSDMFADQRVVLIEGQSFFGLMKLGPGQ